jgi:hypothetical protein
VRNILGQCWFDENKCAQGLEALRAYRKEWDSKNQRFRSQPLHDWASHGADAFRVFAWVTKKKKSHKRKDHDKAVDDYAYI